MKQLMFIGVALALTMSAAGQSKKEKDTTNKMTLTFTETQLGRLWAILYYAKPLLMQTEMSAKTIIFSDSLAQVIVAQSKVWHPEPIIEQKNKADSASGKK